LTFKNTYRVDRSVVTFTGMLEHDWKKYHLTTKSYLFSVFYLSTDAQQSCFTKMLKFTLKQLLQVSVPSPSSGSVLFELAKVIVVKIIC